MIRKAEILISKNNLEIYIDVENKTKIIRYLQQDDKHKKKFKYFCDIFLSGLTNNYLYGKEEIDNKSMGVTAIKFFKGNENDRIYCKEIEHSDKTKVIILSELLTKKKNQKIKQREKNIIHKVGGYNYELGK